MPISAHKLINQTSIICFIRKTVLNVYHVSRTLLGTGHTVWARQKGWLLVALGMVLSTPREPQLGQVFTWVPEKVFSVSSIRNPTSYCLYGKGNLCAYIFIKAVPAAQPCAWAPGFFLSLYSATHEVGLTLSQAPLEVQKNHSCSWGVSCFFVYIQQERKSISVQAVTPNVL